MKTRGMLTILVVVVASGCATMPIIGPMSTPGWDKATLSSNWSGDNAGMRNMNCGSPAMSESTFKNRIEWQKDRGCNTVHLFVSNQGDGQYAGYCIYGNSWDWSIDKAYCATLRDRISYARNKGMAVVLWLFADDSTAWNREAAKDFPRYLKDLDNEGLLKYASTVVVGLELNEYYNASQVAELVKATRAVYGGKVGTHETSGRVEFAGLGDIAFYQVSPGKSAAQIKSEAAHIRAATGKPLNFFELDRHENRALSEAALSGGAFGVGNW